MVYHTNASVSNKPNRIAEPKRRVSNGKAPQSTFNFQRTWCGLSKENLRNKSYSS